MRVILSPKKWEGDMEKIIDSLEKCKLAKKQFFQNLTVFPLIGPEHFEPFYLTLEEALGDGCIQLLELDEQGSVSDVRLLNHDEKPVLIIEGEAIVGANSLMRRSGGKPSRALISACNGEMVTGQIKDASGMISPKNPDNWA